MICEKCGHEIPAKTDDKYDSTHDNICCDECGHWQRVDWSDYE